ncbi:Predicted ATP-dependent endonuclease of the OLD family, contains P-loop ATPase and TOPRIM domains [Filimonas lacunae]|uniref:Predicted ATP-dependent endonuclease of the OLD family, contains P-loop ATPase and TOPRIM domains n=1 Tax=Filimonas lacunae TaxID=477680 RepID=A0A173MHP2_9BACT|nr:ATP-binding protein [Filimonas lacunae]BAV07006.1 hypothetical protein FLA_3026 [Filimonas lacunae]SIS96524.1 Predicted ATP-dependent endonuclease of the OLD family, contains P-loop ATPase and TOPRIM domains [Filimonas lacunae]
MINEITIPAEIRREYILREEDTSLKSISRVNIFIGPNNSGKSRLLRNLFIDDFNYKTSEYDFDDFLTKIKSLYSEIDNFMEDHGLIDISGNNGDPRKKLQEIITQIETANLREQLKAAQQFTSYINSLKQFYVNGYNSKNGNKQPTPDIVAKKLQSLGSSYSEKITANYENASFVEFKKTYIPILRGLRPIQLQNSDNTYIATGFNNYLSRTIKDYFAKTENDQFKLPPKATIATGLDLFEIIKKMHSGTKENRDKLKAFNKFLSINFFDSKEVEIIPLESDHVLHVTIGNEERPIYNLGDGIQSLILLLYPIYFNDNTPHLCFIEEPELSLHPGMQRLFLDTILSNQFSNIQFFISTHSNHFLDMTLDHDQISIYNLNKVSESQKFEITNTNNTDIKILNTLGVKNSSVFLSNCTIWIEGISDRFYINKYLEIYQKSKLGKDYESKRFKEDFHFSYVEYGGSNIIHYSFEEMSNWEKIKATRISNKILVIVDSDDTNINNKSKKAERLRMLKENLGDQLIILPCREIENTLSPKIIRDIIKTREGVSEIEFNFSESDYKNKYLGTFIEKNATGITKKYSQKSGTIYNKVDFAKIAVEQIQELDDLSFSGREIAENIFNFISDHN